MVFINNICNRKHPHKGTSMNLRNKTDDWLVSGWIIRA